MLCVFVCHKLLVALFGLQRKLVCFNHTINVSSQSDPFNPLTIDSSAQARREINRRVWDFCIGAGGEPDRFMFLPDGPVSLCISLEGALSVSHLGRVFLRWKPFRISAKSWSTMQPSSCGTGPLLTGMIEHTFLLRLGEPMETCFWDNNN